MYARLLALLLALAMLSCAGAWAEDAPETPENPPAEAEEAALPAKGYVQVTTATFSGWLPLPAEGESVFPLRQILPDGTEAINTIHLTPEGVYMEDSTCANHDCVEQGEVTLDNLRNRLLGNMIICLPNQVILALYTPEEVLTLFNGGQAGGLLPEGAQQRGSTVLP